MDNGRERRRSPTVNIHHCPTNLTTRCMRQSTCRSAVAKVSKPITGGGAYRAVALVGRPYLWPAHFIGDVNFFFVYIAIMTGENLQ